MIGIYTRFVVVGTNGGGGGWLSVYQERVECTLQINTVQGLSQDRRISRNKHGEAAVVVRTEMIGECTDL